MFRMLSLILYSRLQHGRSGSYSLVFQFGMKDLRLSAWSSGVVCGDTTQARRTPSSLFLIPADRKLRHCESKCPAPHACYDSARAVVAVPSQRGQQQPITL